MHYECPNCKSVKFPKTISYFPPKIMQCQECGQKGNEKEFIKEERYHFTPIPHLNSTQS